MVPISANCSLNSERQPEETKRSMPGQTTTTTRWTHSYRKKFSLTIVKFVYTRGKDFFPP